MPPGDLAWTSINSLPDELLYEIVDLLESCQDVHALVMTNRRFHALCERKLYKMDTQPDANGYSRSLFWAASLCDFVVANKLINFGCNLDATCSYLEETSQPLTAVNIAMMESHVPMLSVLMTAGAGVDKAPDAANIPIFYALEKGWLDVFKMLVSVGNADLQVVDHNKHGILTAAARLSNTAAIHYIASGFPNFTEPIHAVSSPFHQAICNIDFDTLTALLRYTQCSPAHLNDEGMTPLQLACEQGLLAFVSALMDDGRAHSEHTRTDDAFMVLNTFREEYYDIVALLLSHKNPCIPHSHVFTEACKVGDTFIAYKALELLEPSKTKARQWRACAQNNGLHELALMMTYGLNLDEE